MAQVPVSNGQASLALTQYFPLNGIYPSQGGGGSGYLLGDIGTFAGNFTPADVFADGSLLAISDNDAMFSLIGTIYGGDGQTTFAVPNLSGATMVGIGQGVGLGPVAIGQQLGTSSTTLSFAETPPNIGGQGQPFDNYQPSLGITYGIVSQGIFPSGDGGMTLDSLGVIVPFAGSFNPGAMLACNGQLLTIAQNQALFSILGTTYGGDGRTTFALPDLRGRDIIGASATDPIGTKVGQPTISLSNGQAPDGLGGPVAPIDNREPSLAMEYLIATQGIFPSRDGGGQDNSTPLLGQVVPFAGSFVPKGWALCDGSLLSIAQNTALFSLLGTFYGGDGRTTFALPDLRDKTVIGATANIPLGMTLGENSTTIASAQLPDTPPVITSNGGGTTAGISLTSSQTLVTTVTATDVDVGQTLALSIPAARTRRFSTSSTVTS
jgi:microcystin-dependent protein